MNAVLERPRAKAKPKAEKSALQARLDKIFNNLKLGQEKLQLAHQSVGLTDPGEAAEVLLRAVIEDMLPPAIAPMYHQPLTRADADEAYTGMFTSLAAIDGVIALSLGHVIESTLRDAWVLLDEANSLMDFGDMKGALPEAEPAPKQPRTEATSATSREPAAASFEALDIEEGPYFMISEVIGIIESRLSDIGTDLLYGAMTCAEKAKEVLSAGVKARDVQMCEAASAPLAVATAVLEASLEADDDVALWGALRLLKLAHDTLDEAVAQGVAA
ncbi:hypothetical protein [Variovorax sp. tm]|uniref:hypothetical protein n=1 Tax=Variovorax atrisoli TaxID=3394203 RepID=UPI003A80D678